MKRLALSTLSLSLLAATGAAHAQTSVTLYGLIDESISFVHNSQTGAEHTRARPVVRTNGCSANSSNGNLAGTRWGMKGNEDLGGGLAAIFTLEGGFNPSTGAEAQGSRLFGRQAFVGLSSNTAGTITVGRQYDPLVDLVQPLTEDNYFGSTFATIGDVDNYDNSSRTNNAIKYLSPTIAASSSKACTHWAARPARRAQARRGPPRSPTTTARSAWLPVTSLLTTATARAR